MSCSDLIAGRSLRAHRLKCTGQKGRRPGDGFSQLSLEYKPALINGTPGIACVRLGQAFSVIGFTIAADMVTEINILADPDRLRKLDLSAFEDRRP